MAHTFEQNKTYEVNIRFNKGTYKVMEISQPAPITGTVYVWFIGLTGDVGNGSFMVGSDFAYYSKLL